jgi:hypothetical protein
MHWRPHHLVIVLLIFFVGLFLALYGVSFAQQNSLISVEVPSGNRDKFSDVIVLLDGTRSMSEGAFADAKEIVKRRIIKAIGTGDVVTCYTIGQNFSDRNNVFGKTHEEQPPQLAEAAAQKVLGLYEPGDVPGSQKVCGADRCDIIEELKPNESKVQEVQNRWAGQVDALARPEIDGSDYVGALEGIKRQLANIRPGQTDRDVWVFIVGDLINASTHPHPKETDGEAFKNVNHIVLIYPFNSNRDWERTRDFWKRYFGDVKFEEYTFATALREEYVIKPNPTFGLKKHPSGDFWQSLRPFLYADAALLFILILLIAVSFMLQRRSARRAAALAASAVAVSSDMFE